MKPERKNTFTYHLRHPFTAITTKGKEVKVNKGKVATIAISALVGAVTFGVGGVVCFYGLTALKKVALLKKMNKEAEKTDEAARTTLFDLPEEMRVKIAENLRHKDLDNLAKADLRLTVAAGDVYLNQARKYGFEGDTAIDAKKYFSQLSAALNYLNHEGTIPKSKKVAAKGFTSRAFPAMSFEKKINIKKTLDKMETVTQQDIAILLGTRELYAGHNIDMKVLTHFLSTRKIEPSDELDKNKLNRILMNAVIQEDAAAVKLMLGVGADPSYTESTNYEYYFFESALIPASCSFKDHSVLELADVEISELLINAKANVNAMSLFGKTALDIAVEKGDFEKVKLLLEKGADLKKSKDPVRLVGKAINSRRNDILEILLKHNSEAEPIIWPASLLERAISRKNQKAIDLLRKYGVDVNSDHGRALRRAVIHGNFKTADWMVKAGANLNLINRNHTHLTYAVERGKIKEILFLLRYGADPNFSNGRQTPLHCAAINGKLEAAVSLVEYGADPNKKNEAGWTPLYQASGNRRFQVAHFLLEKGADPNEESDGYYPLHQVANNGKPKDIELAKDLIVHGADVNRASDAGTPLMIAASSNNLEMLELLLKRGADPDICVNNVGALHLAIQKGHYRIAKALLENNANPNLPNNWGETPLDYANARKNQLIIELVRSKGGNPRSI